MQRNTKQRLVLKYIFLLLVCLSFNLYAQDFWTKTGGPEGGSIKIVRSHPDGEIFLVTNYGYVHVSTDDGLTWTRLSSEPPNANDMVIDSDGNIYVAVWDAGVYRSVDKGKSWTLASNGLTNKSVYTISYNANTNNLYVGTNRGGIFRSGDGGDNWAPINTGLINYENLRIQSIHTSPNGDLYTAGWDWSQEGGVYFSTNDGNIWTRINGDLPTTNIRSVAVDAENRIFCATYGSGIFRSADGGTTWQNMVSGITTTFFGQLMITPGGTLFAGSINGGLFVSSDNGDNWVHVEGVISNQVLSMTVKRSNNAVFVGMLGAGIFRSNDMGVSWTEINNGILYSPIDDLIVTSEDIIFTSIIQSGIARSMDGGETWQRVNNGLTDPSVFTFAAKPGFIFAGSQIQGVLRSIDNGASWQPVNNGNPNTYVRTVFIDHHGSVYAGTSFQKLYRSDNNGDDWIEVYTATANQMVETMVADEGSDAVFAGLSLDGGIIRSKDGGVSWEAVNNGLVNLSVHSLALSPPNDLLAGTELGLYRSSDNGDSWNRVITSDVPDFIKKVVVNPLGHIFLATNFNFGVFVSKDNGVSWNTVNSGLDYLIVQALALDLENNLLVGILDGGVYKSTRSTTDIQVHFSVKMRNQDGFDPSSQTVVVRGDFNGWGEDDLVLTSQDDEEMTYVGSISITDMAGAIQDGFFRYKYVIPPDNWELFDYNRTAEWDGRDDFVLETVWFSNQKDFTRMSTSAISVDGTDSRGVAWADYDNDGHEDLIIVESGATSRNDLFHNNGDGTFTQITTGPIGTDNGDSRTACWGDYNNDGYIDLYITNLGGQNNFLYKNNGDGSFTGITNSETVIHGGSSVSAVWADFDNDGFLDLFVANTAGESNFLYMNNQDGTFMTVLGQSLVTDISDSRGCAAADYDNDGDVDIFVANAGDGENNFLYRNDQFGIFTKIPDGPVVNDGTVSSGGSWGDYNNDGWLDLYVANRDGTPNMLYKNDQAGGFSLVGPAEILGDSTDSRGSAWVDVDNDGLLDLYVANANNQKNILYKQQAGGNFLRVFSGPIVEDPNTDSRGAAWADFNNDGFPDLIIGNNGGSNPLYRNNIFGNHYLKVKLIGTLSNSSALGAIVLAHHADTDGNAVVQRRDILGQTGFLSQNSTTVTFGIGEKTKIDSLIIYWPGGMKQAITDIPNLDQLITITEPNPMVPPPTPILNNPQNGATDVSVNPTLAWNQAGDAIQYHLLFSNSSTFSTVTDEDTAVMQTSYSLSGLQYDQSYYWQVRGKNDSGWGLWSEVWSFTTEQFFGTPNPPTLTNPPIEQQGVPIPALLTWTSEATGTYTVQVATDNAFSDTVYNNGIVTDTKVFVSNLDHNTTYFWQVNVTISGIISAWSQSRSFTTYSDKIQVTKTKSFPLHDRRDDFLSSDYLLIGLPGNADVFFRDVLGEGAEEKWMAYWDNGKTGTRQEYFVPYNTSDIFKFRTGRAFWIIHNGTITINEAIPNASLNEFAQAEVNVHSGWNIITCPFGISVSWDAVKEANGITAAIPLYRYDRPNRKFTEYTNLEPMEGFYFHNNQDARTTLLVPYIVSFNKPLVSRDVIWDLKIELSSGETKAASSRIGVGLNAEIGLDNFDYRKPRALADLADIYFERPEWDSDYSRFGSDIRPRINEVEVWDFKVYAPQKSESELTFPGITNIPEEYEVYLIDKTRLTYQDLRANDRYEFISTPEISEFDIIVGNAEAVEEKLKAVIPMTYTLGQNYPNPFNPTTTIPLTLPEQSEINLKVFNVLGQEVITLFKGTLNAGRHYFLWEGTNRAKTLMPSGIYIYQMTTNTGFQFAGKMVLIK